MNSEKYKGKYRIASARLASWDYGSNAAYFITICVQNRAHAFGEVVDGEMRLTPLGQAAWDCWYAIPEHFPFVLLDAFVAMPNHVHGIVIIDKQTQQQQTQNIASLRGQSTNRFGPQSQNLASIVRGVKIGVTKYARLQQIEFAWQPRYHDHIVRNTVEYQRIHTYIVENPQRWIADTFHM